MQQSAKISEIAVTLTSRGEAFGKEYDAIEFVCGHDFGHCRKVGNIDDFEAIGAINGVFALSYDHVVLRKGMLNPLLGNEVGVADQKHFHAATPANTPLTGLRHNSAHKTPIVAALRCSSVAKQQTDSPSNGGFLGHFSVTRKST